MEPNNLENQFAEKLNAREIKPSLMAWDRLDAMLSVAEEKKTTRSPFLSYRYLGIASSILVLFSLGLFFFQQKEIIVKPENNVVVKEKSKVDENNNKFNNGNENSNSNKSANNKQVAATSTHKFIPAENPLITENKEIELESTEIIAQNQFQIVEPSKEIKASNSIKVNAVDLLASVDKATKPNTGPKIKINPNSLLSQVDGELAQTFREKVLTRVTKNYKEIKVALATRNQE